MQNHGTATAERPTMSDLRYDVFKTSWGWMGAIGSGRGIRYASLPEAGPIDVVEYLESCSKKLLPEHVPGAFEAYRQQLEAYFADGLIAWDVALDLEGATEFYARAWEACQAIPPGETRTYAWLAAQAGRPAAARGAGQAMARNRVPIIIPCHRVIGSDGGLHGFAGPGLPMKARLLQHEAR